MTKTAMALVLVAAASLSGTAVLGQTYEPQVPNPADPFPANPIATDGSSLRGVWPSDVRAIASARRGVPDAEFQAYSPRGGTLRVR